VCVGALDHRPIVNPARRLADRLVLTVLRQRGEEQFRPPSSQLMQHAVVRLDWFLHGLRARWPIRIEATYGLDGTIDSPFQLRYQVQTCVGRSISFAAGRPHGEH